MTRTKYDTLFILLAVAACFGASRVAWQRVTSGEMTRVIRISGAIPATRIAAAKPMQALLPAADGRNGADLLPPQLPMLLAARQTQSGAHHPLPYGEGLPAKTATAIAPPIFYSLATGLSADPSTSVRSTSFTTPATR